MSTQSIIGKTWYAGGMRLSELEDLIAAAKKDIESGEDPIVVVVFDPQAPKEATPNSVVMRSRVLDSELGEHLNGLSTQVTEAELHDASELMDQAMSEGEVMYITLSISRDRGDAEVYKY